MIQISNVEFFYKKGNTILKDLNLNLERGYIYGLLGKNGTGKSTLLKLISGMIFPKAGEIENMGTNPAKRLPSFMTQLYYIPEEISTPSVSMNQYAKHTAPFYANFSYDDLQTYMDEFELDCKQKISSMSLGQKKKAIIAFALACNTQLLIMDEPTNGLDIPSKKQFRKIISNIATEDRCIVISTHQVRDLENLIDSLVILEHSEIIVNASMDKISKKLMFKMLEKDEKFIYEETSIRGKFGIVENIDEQENKVDIELFFNAAIEQHELINRLLNR